MLSAQEALDRLKQGNDRFVSKSERHAAMQPPIPEDKLLEQKPNAIILGCSDSRVPLEIVFDQGVGELFVIRVAGNIVAPSQVGSVEYAAAQFSTPLVVVLGHTNCGAVTATLQELKRPIANRSPNLHSIVDRIKPSIMPLYEVCKTKNLEAMVGPAVRANIRASVDHLRHGSQILEELIANNGLAIVGAEYDLNTGHVEFFDEG